MSGAFFTKFLDDVPFNGLDIFSIMWRLTFRVSFKKTGALSKNIFGWVDLFNFLENITS